MKLEIRDDKKDILELWLEKHGETVYLISNLNGDKRTEFKIYTDNGWLKLINGHLNNEE